MTVYELRKALEQYAPGAEVRMEIRRWETNYTDWIVRLEGNSDCNVVSLISTPDLDDERETNP